MPNKMDAFERLVVMIFVFIMLVITSVVGTAIYLAVKNFG